MRKDWFTEDIVSEERSVIVLAFLIGLVFVASFAILLAGPVMRVQVHEAETLSSPSPLKARIEKGSHD